MENTVNARNELVDVDKIKELCKSKDIKFAALGRKIGLSFRDSISRRLKNQCVITSDEIFKIADELGVSADDLRLS